ncbi:DUF7503 family protein [Halorarum salinum]|nr:hypothetical protein [Halobaculum salinum]
MSEANRMSEFLAEHPKMVGALFTMTLLLSQAGAVMAGSSATAGP